MKKQSKTLPDGHTGTHKAVNAQMGTISRQIDKSFDLSDILPLFAKAKRLEKEFLLFTQT